MPAREASASCLKDDSFARSLNSTTNNIDQLVARLNKGEGTAGKLITDPALYNRLNSLSERLDQLLTRLNDGEGTAGQLLKDKQLYENMNKVMVDAVGAAGGDHQGSEEVSEREGQHLLNAEPEQRRAGTAREQETHMARDDGAGSGSILLAFILGAVSGAAVALLYAPASGDDTRRYLGEKAREGRDRAAEMAEKGRQAMNEGRETLTTAIDRGREAYQQARRENA